MAKSISAVGGCARYGAAYAAVYLGTGIATPYMPTWFQAAGLEGAQIGVVLAIPMLGRIVTGPLIAFWADGFGERRTPVVLLATVAALALSLLPVANGLSAIAVLWFIAVTALGAISPLLDVIVLRHAATERFSYAVPRGIGSAAYVAGNVAVGLVLARSGPAIAVTGSACSAVLAALTFRALLPADLVHGAGAPSVRDRLGAFRSVVTDRTFAMIIVTGGLIQGANSFYYGFSALIWRGQGIDPGMVGLFWGVGVGCEVAFLWFCEPLRRRLGPERMLLVAAVASVARWSILAFSPPVWMLWPLQSLHALTLSAPFVASLQLVDRHAPSRSASAAQQVNAALSTGLIMGAATLAGGALYDGLGALGYLLMALMAFVGLCGAVRLVRPISPALDGARLARRSAPSS